MDGTGKHDDFVSIYDRHVDTVYRICFTHLRNVAETEDAVQEVFIKLLAKPVSFASQEHQKAWLIRVAINHCRDVLKNAWSRRASLEVVPEPYTTDPAPDDTLAVVLGLPENLRVCTYLYYYEGYNAAEIAQMIDRPHSTVRNYLSEARKLLKKRLADGFDG
jgi:RNA polymerase sigma-70 factor (ECF subfamily)